MGSTAPFTAPLIAVVDDEESIRRAMLRLLRSANFRAVAFCSGLDFLDSLSDQMPDCVILDLQMPKLTGLELQQQLKEHARAPPIIIMTAHDEPGARERSLALGASFYLRKPIDSTTLFASIAKVLEDALPRRLVHLPPGDSGRDDGERHRAGDDLPGDRLQQVHCRRILQSDR